MWTCARYGFPQLHHTHEKTNTKFVFFFLWVVETASNSQELDFIVLFFPPILTILLTYMMFYFIISTHTISTRTKSVEVALWLTSIENVATHECKLSGLAQNTLSGMDIPKLR